MMTEEHDQDLINTVIFPSVSENHNPNLVNFENFASIGHKGVNDEALGRTAENNEVEQATLSPEVSKAAASMSTETPIVAPSPSRRHFCKSPRCAANNPEYAQRAALPPRKYLVSRRHSLRAEGAECPSAGSRFRVSAPKGTPHNHVKSSPARGKWDANSVEHVACCIASAEESGNSEYGERMIDFEAVETAMNEDEERQNRAGIMQQGDVMWKETKNEDHGLHFAIDDDAEEVRIKTRMVNNISLPLKAKQEQEEKQEQEQEDHNLHLPVKQTEHNGTPNSCKPLSRELVSESRSSFLAGADEAVATSPACLATPTPSENGNKSEDSRNNSTRNHETCNHNRESLVVSSSDEKNRSRRNILDSKGHKCKDSDAYNHHTPDMDSASVAKGIVVVEEYEPASSSHDLVAVSSEEECKRTDHFMTMSANVQVDTGDLEATNGSEGAMCANGRASPEHSAATESHETFGGELQRIFEKRKLREWRFDVALAEACKKVSHEGEGRVRLLVEAFESIISLTELEAEESRLMTSQKKERIQSRSPERHSHPSATQHETMCSKQAEAACAKPHQENFNLSEVEQNTRVHIHHNNKMPEEQTLNMNNVENNITLLGEHNVITAATVYNIVHPPKDDVTLDYCTLMLVKSGNEQSDNLLNSPSRVIGESILIRPKTDVNPINEQKTKITPEESQREEECATPIYLENEIVQASNFGVSLYNSFQSQKTGLFSGTSLRKSNFAFLQPFALRAESRGARKKYEYARKLSTMFSEEQRMRNSIAQKWTNVEPQVLSKHPTSENPEHLNGRHLNTIRACEHAEFDAYVAASISLMDQENEHRILKQTAEEEKIKRLRREMVLNVQLMPYFNRSLSER